MGVAESVLAPQHGQQDQPILTIRSDHSAFLLSDMPSFCC